MTLNFFRWPILKYTTSEVLPMGLVPCSTDFRSGSRWLVCYFGKQQDEDMSPPSWKEFKSISTRDKPGIQNVTRRWGKIKWFFVSHLFTFETYISNISFLLSLFQVINMVLILYYSNGSILKLNLIHYTILNKYISLLYHHSLDHNYTSFRKRSNSL